MVLGVFADISWVRRGGLFFLGLEEVVGFLGVFEYGLCGNIRVCFR